MREKRLNSILENLNRQGPDMLIDDNTNGIGEPGTYLQRHGLAGMGTLTYDAFGNIIDDTTAQPADTSSGIDWGTIGAAINTEGLYLTNLYRAATNQPAVQPAAVAPQVNVGLSQQTMIFGAVAIAALLLLTGKKR